MMNVSSLVLRLIDTMRPKSHSIPRNRPKSTNVLRKFIFLSVSVQKAKFKDQSSKSKVGESHGYLAFNFQLWTFDSHLRRTAQIPTPTPSVPRTRNQPGNRTIRAP